MRMKDRVRVSTVPRPSSMACVVRLRRAVVNCLGSPTVPTRQSRLGTPSSSTPATLAAFLAVLEAVPLWPCNAHNTCGALQPSWPSPRFPGCAEVPKKTYRWG